MHSYIIDKHILKHLTKAIWLAGLIIFIALAYKHAFGTLDFLFKTFSSLVSETTVSVVSIEHAKGTLSKLFPVFILCSICQLTVFSVPFLLTGSKDAIAYYHDREADYTQALQDRLKLAKQITDTSEQLEQLKVGVLNCRALLTHLSRDTKILMEAVELTRESLPAHYRKSKKKNDKGDF